MNYAAGGYYKSRLRKKGGGKAKSGLSISWSQKKYTRDGGNEDGRQTGKLRKGPGKKMIRGSPFVGLELLLLFSPGLSLFGFFFFFLKLD